MLTGWLPVRRQSSPYYRTWFHSGPATDSCPTQQLVLSAHTLSLSVHVIKMSYVVSACSYYGVLGLSLLPSADLVELVQRDGAAHSSGLLLFWDQRTKLLQTASGGMGAWTLLVSGTHANSDAWPYGAQASLKVLHSADSLHAPLCL